MTKNNDPAIVKDSCLAWIGILRGLRADLALARDQGNKSWEDSLQAELSEYSKGATEWLRANNHNLDTLTHSELSGLLHA